MATEMNYHRFGLRTAEIFSFVFLETRSYTKQLQGYTPPGSSRGDSVLGLFFPDLVAAVIPGPVVLSFKSLPSSLQLSPL